MEMGDQLYAPADLYPKEETVASISLAGRVTEAAFTL
jgi:hypothetical protein